ncbi:MAG: segregation and condensation protein A [Erysipelotrichaceae bacterium]
MIQNQEFKVTIENFDGPLDLMLHLIKEKKLDLFDLDVLALANQYIAFIREMEAINLEIASEYLVEMAALIEYKSKKLLPRETAVLDSEYQDIDHEKLVERLLEYQRFKDASTQLAILSQERQKLLTRSQSYLVNEWSLESTTKIEPKAIYHLYQAMERCQARLRELDPLPVKVAEKEMSVQERSEKMYQIIKGLPTVFNFDDLCRDATSLIIVILTFLAILEMIKIGDLVYQLKNDELYFQRGVNYGK